MEAVSNFLYWLDDLLWGNAMTVIVVGTGILLSLRFAFAYQRKIRFNFKNTFAKMFDKGEGEGTITGFQAALFRMHAYEKAVTAFYYGLGYGATSKTLIPSYSSLQFELELVDKQ